MTESKKQILAQEQIMLAEERTLLAYIRTGLAVIAVALILLKFYFGTNLWVNLLAVAVVLLGVTIIIEEIYRFKRLKKKRNSFS